MVGSRVSSSCVGTTTAFVVKLTVVAFSGILPLPTLRLFFGKSFAFLLFARFISRARSTWLVLQSGTGEILAIETHQSKTERFYHVTKNDVLRVFPTVRRICLAPLVAVIATQDQTLEIDPNDIFAAKTEIRASNRQHSEDRANVIHSQLTPELKRCVDLAKERGASSWLSVLPLSEQGFHLHKGEFRDALCLRYGWSLSALQLR